MNIIRFPFNHSFSSTILFVRRQTEKIILKTTSILWKTTNTIILAYDKHSHSCFSIAIFTNLAQNVQQTSLKKKMHLSI